METGTNAAEDAAEDVAEEQTEEPVEEQSGQPAEEQSAELAEEQSEESAEEQSAELAEEQSEETAEEQTMESAEEQEEPAAEDEDEGGPAGTRNGSIESPADESISDGDMDEDIWEDAVQEEIPVPEELEQSEAMYSEADAAGGDSAEIGSWAELKQMINECEVEIGSWAELKQMINECEVGGSITLERETVRESAAATMVTAARSPSTAAPSRPPKSTRGRVRASAAAATLLQARSP